MYCPYCRWITTPIRKSIDDTSPPRWQVLPACCFENVRIEEPNAFCFETISLQGMIMEKWRALHNAPDVSCLGGRDMFLLAEMLGLVKHPVLANP